MTPDIDERLASVVRALTDVILPSLPPEASLAAEQAHLSIGHLQIIRAQMDAAPGYEAEELADARALGTSLTNGISGGPSTTKALAGIANALKSEGNARDARRAIHASIASLIRAVSQDGDAGARQSVSATILAEQKARVLKDRKWFAPFGFDKV
jgi:hypothetical protein